MAGRADRTYVPETGPTVEGESSLALLAWLQDELLRIATSFHEQPFMRLSQLDVEPDKPRNGMVVYADGTNWNPGSGEGVYAYEGGVWVKL